MAELLHSLSGLVDVISVIVVVLFFWWMSQT